MIKLKKEMVKKEYILYLISVLLGGLFFFTGNLIYVVIALVIALCFLYKYKNFKGFMLAMFLIYISGLLYYTLNYHKENYIYFFNYGYFVEYLSKCNFIPLKSIIDFWITFSDYVTTKDVVFNLIGNFICLVPLSLFIPYFFKKGRNCFKFTLIILGVTLGIELFQFVLMLGYFDIDDIILNSFGCLIFYYLFHKEIIRFFDNNYKIVNNRKELLWFLLKIGVVFIGCLVVFEGFFYRNQKEKDYWRDYHYQQVELINYEEDNNYRVLLYKDDIYEYYVNCKLDNIDVKINDRIVKLDDFINDRTVFPFRIDRLEDAGMKMEKVERWEKFRVNSKEMQPITYYVENMEVIELQHIGVYVGYNEFYVIVREQGETDVYFDVDGKNISYHFEVDEKNKVSYYFNESEE